MRKPEETLAVLSGDWEGTCRTWLEPDSLSDESEVQGEICPILGDGFLRHTNTINSSSGTPYSESMPKRDEGKKPKRG